MATEPFLLASAIGPARRGCRVRWVQPCSDDPAMVMLSVRKGAPTAPLIRDSRHFALSRITIDNPLIRRFVDQPQLPADFDESHEHEIDPFIGIDMVKTAHGQPRLRSSSLWIECEVVRHVDIESDFELYVGLVLAGECLDDGCFAR